MSDAHARPSEFPDLEGARAHFPACESLAYFNAAAVAPTSKDAVAAANAWMEIVLRHGLHDEESWEEGAENVRAKCARLIGAQAQEIAFVRSTSHGLGLVAEGLDWQPEDEVIVCAEVEYPSNVYVWEHLQRRGVKVIATAPKDGGLDAYDVQKHITPKTRLVAASAVQYASGHRTDLAALGALCKAHDLLLCVDGIQMVGAFPIDVKGLGIHFLAADSHKWMLGLSGIGFLYVDAAKLSQLTPVLVGWKSTSEPFNFDQSRFDLRQDAAKFEEGSPNYAGIMAMGASVDLILSRGLDAVAAHITKVLDVIEAALVDKGWQVSPPPQSRAGILMLTPPAGADLEQIAEACVRADVSVSIRRGRLRVAPHMYTHSADVQRLLCALA